MLILSPAFQVEGIFRVPGSNDMIQEIKEQYETEGCPQVSLRDEDPHTVAGILKLYFRELKEPLIPFAKYETFAKLGKPPPQDSTVEEEIKRAVDQLQDVNRFNR